LVVSFLATLTLESAQAEAPAPIDEMELPQVPEYKEYALRRVVEEWSLDEWESFNKLVQKESSWNNEAQNPVSTAFGTMQFLDSTWKTVGCVKTIDQNKQIDCGIKYIKARYGSPQKALQFHLQNNHY
jgi:membrane-bound lytic murein transglycosylase MltF